MIPSLPMSWFYEKWSVPSERNGRIDCIRALGKWSVDVNGTNESSSYMYGLWKQAVRHVPKTTSVKRILLLGLAAGSCVEMLHRRFPGCHVTAVEWDPVMIELMKKFRLFHPSHCPEILLGDAAEIVPTITHTYDLIISDLFRGPETPDQVKSSAFFASLRPLLARDGALLLNVYEQLEILNAADAHFSRQSTWKFHLNHVALYKPLGAGTVGDPLPPGYHPFRTRSEFWRRDVHAWPKTTFIEQNGICGIRSWSSPLCVEKYYGDIEPMIDLSGPKRLIIWQRTRRTDRPTGWRRSFAQMNASVTGFVDLEATDNRAFAWSDHAKRQLKRWEARQHDWELTEPTREEFMRVYMTNPLRKSLRDLHRMIIDQKATAHGDRLHFMALKRRSSGTIEAGFVYLDIPELNQSVHIASYILPSAKTDGVGTGLVDVWFKKTIASGLRFADFDLFRGPHDPREWNGFTRFKSQFGTRFIRYPLPLIRWTGTWKEYIRHFTTSKRSG